MDLSARTLPWLMGFALFAVLIAGFGSGLASETDLLGAVLKLVFLVMFALGLYLFLNEDERVSLGLMRNRILFGR